MADDRTLNQKRGKTLMETIAETPVTYPSPYLTWQYVPPWNTTTTTGTGWNITNTTVSETSYTLTDRDGSTFTYHLDDQGAQRLTSATIYGSRNGLV